MDSINLKSVISTFLAMIALTCYSEATTYTYVDLGVYNVANAITQGTSGYIGGTTVSGGNNRAYYLTYSTTTVGSASIVPLSADNVVNSGCSISTLSTGGDTIIVGQQQGPTYAEAYAYDITASTLTRLFGDGISPNPVNSPTLAFGINEAGMVVGWDDRYNWGFSCTSSGGGLVDYEAPFVSTTQALANAVNVNSVIVGEARTVGGVIEAGVVVSGAWTFPDSISGSALAVNDNTSYAIAGVTANSGTQNGFYYDTGSSTYVQFGSATVAAAAYGINTSDYVVGSVSGSFAPTGTHAFIAYASSTVTDLNNTSIVTNLPSTVELTSANAINNAGYIVGTSQVETTMGRFHVWTQHGYLLVP